jgi:hypothetical protein
MRKWNSWVRTALACGVAAPFVLSAMPGEAQAEVRCGRIPARWNAPRGAAVVTRHEGVMASVFDAVGRYWTHVMLSHGPTSLSHAHRPSPLENPSEAQLLLDLPLLPSSLRASGPGVSKINTAAGYAAQRGGEAALFFRGDARARTVADFIDGLSSIGMTEVVSGTRRSLEFERLLLPRPVGTREVPLVVPYAFSQLKDLGTNHLGEVSRDGMVCSTYMAWAANRALGVRVQPEVFDTRLALRGLKAAADMTEFLCNRDVIPAMSEDWKRSLARSTNACGRAADQIANCLAGVNNFGCDKRGDEWQNPANWPGERNARSIGPDRLIDWGPAVDPGNPSPWTGASTGDRTAALGTPLQWSNDGGETFGCWATDADTGAADPLSSASSTLTTMATRDTQRAPCGPVDIVPQFPTTYAYHVPGRGDAEMGGNRPTIRGDILFAQAGNTITAQTTLTMQENGGDRSFFASTDFPRAIRRPVFVAPAHCEIESVDTFGRSFSSGIVVPDAGHNNHNRTLFTSGVRGLLRSAVCLSDTNGGIGGGSDDGKLFCTWYFHPIRVNLRPRQVTIDPRFLTEFTPGLIGSIPFTPSWGTP